MITVQPQVSASTCKLVYASLVALYITYTQATLPCDFSRTKKMLFLLQASLTEKSSSLPLIRISAC